MTDQPKAPPTPIGSDLVPLRLEHLGEIENACRGPAISAVISKRVEQIVRFGHDAERDGMQPIDRLPADGAERVQAALQMIRAPKDRRDLAGARRCLVTGVAQLLAGIDRLDAAIEVEKKQGGLPL